MRLKYYYHDNNNRIQFNELSSILPFNHYHNSWLSYKVHMSHIRLENYKRKCQIISTMLVHEIIILPLIKSSGITFLSSLQKFYP